MLHLLIYAYDPHAFTNQNISTSMMMHAIMDIYRIKIVEFEFIKSIPIIWLDCRIFILSNPMISKECLLFPFMMFWLFILVFFYQLSIYKSIWYT